MAAIRGMLARLQRLEAARQPRKSPIAKGWGSFEAFAEQILAEIETGALDRDFPLPHLERWEREQLR
ncbi:hypothetical protein [Albidovulum sp.]|uniref:hypothetical protein n=1 Tax=Albidovulum sp. TaxID=1872424 RepID=UPI0039B9723E